MTETENPAPVPKHHFKKKVVDLWFEPPKAAALKDSAADDEVTDKGKRRATDATLLAGVETPPCQNAAPRRATTVTDLAGNEGPKPPRRGPRPSDTRNPSAVSFADSFSTVGAMSDDGCPTGVLTPTDGEGTSSRPSDGNFSPFQRSSVASATSIATTSSADTTGCIRVRVTGKEALGKRGRHAWAPMLRKGLRCETRPESEALLASFTVEPVLDSDGGLAWAPKPINAPIFSVSRPRPDLAVATDAAGAVRVERYRPISRLGTGSFGSVVLYIGDRGGPPLAVKSVYAGHAEKRGMTKKEFAQLRRDFQEVASSNAVADAAAALAEKPEEETDGLAGAIICSRLALEATRLGEVDLWGRDPHAWTVLLMEPWEGSLLDFEDSFSVGEDGKSSGDINALDSLNLASGVLRAARALLRDSGIAWVDGKTGNVLYSSVGTNGMRLTFGDLGGICPAGEHADCPATFPWPFEPIGPARGDEPTVAWGVVAMVVQLFSQRLLKGRIPGSTVNLHERFDGYAWKALAWDYAKKRGRKNTLPGLLDLLQSLTTASFATDPDTGLIRDFLVHVTSYAKDPRTGSATCSPDRITFSGVKEALDRFRRKLQPRLAGRSSTQSMGGARSDDYGELRSVSERGVDMPPWASPGGPRAEKGQPQRMSDTAAVVATGAGRRRSSVANGSVRNGNANAGSQRSSFATAATTGATGGGGSFLSSAVNGGESSIFSLESTVIKEHDEAPSSAGGDGRQSKKRAKDRRGATRDVKKAHRDGEGGFRARVLAWFRGEQARQPEQQQARTPTGCF